MMRDMPAGPVSINPATGEIIKQYQWDDETALDAKLQTLKRASDVWCHDAFSNRSQLFHSLAKGLRDESSRLAALVTLEMGKPIAEAEAEIEKCAFACDFFADNAESFLTAQAVPSDTPNSVITFEPLGAILAIMPWNFPFWQVFRHAAPTIMAGNVIAVKHAPNVPECAIAIESLFTRSGFPEGVLTNVVVDIGSVESLIANPAIRGVTLTGSERAGRSVAALAGRHLKKTVLELGGSDPFVVLSDADLLSTVEAAIRARFQNCGQSCIAAKRFVIHESIADDFEESFAERVSQLVVGDPSDRSTQIGPLAREDLLDNLVRQVDESLTTGAKTLIGGNRMDRPGFFLEPTVLAHLKPGSSVLREETFGPVAAVVRVNNDAEAIAMANDTDYGLGASIWSEDLDRARRIARQIQAGSVFINGVVHSDPRIPFGGIRSSGYGRELSEFGMREFVNIKTIWRP